MASVKDFIPSDEIRDTNRAIIKKEWLHQGVYVRFRHAGRLYLVPHDDLVAIARQVTPWLRSDSWRENGVYSTPRPSRKMLARLSKYAVLTE